jgi:hypothetical protein
MNEPSNSSKINLDKIEITYVRTKMTKTNSPETGLGDGGFDGNP